jgi:hypothetical protein
MRNESARRNGLPFLPMFFALVLSCGLQGAAHAQTTTASAPPAAKPKTQAAVLRYATAGQAAPKSMREAAPKSADQIGPKIADPYYIEFRSRYAQSYGHAFVVFGRGVGPGKKITTNQIAGLHPATDSPIPFWVGHVVPVAAETGASEGDTDEIYVSARYRVNLTKPEYDKVVAFIRKLQKTKTLWQEMVYNCNDFVADIARFVGLKTPTTMQMPQDFILQLAKLNTGRQHAPIAVEGVQQASSPSRQSVQ